MNKIFLPELISIEVKNFTLYSKSPSFKYEFVKGVNLVIGGNGVGKTTFVNLIKYGLIGLYKKDYDYTRTYMGRKIEKRVQISEGFFYNRMSLKDYSVKKDINSEVILTFKVQDFYFTVTRGLVDITLHDVKVQKYSLDNLGVIELDGKILSQYKYERIDGNEKSEYLQYKYEKIVAEQCGFGSFDDLIFFVNEILFFGEDHKTILWNEEYDQIQMKLTSKYFNDPGIDKKRRDSLSQEKYFDSLSRHKSEDMRVISQLLKEFHANDVNNSKPLKSLVDLEILRLKLDKLSESLESIHATRNQSVREISAINKSINEVDLKRQAVESIIHKQQQNIESDIFTKLNPKYDTYLDQISRNCLCPMCNQDLGREFTEYLDSHKDNCIVCDQLISTKHESAKVDPALIDELNNLQRTVNDYQKKRIDLEERIIELDGEYEKVNRSLFKERNSLRQLEHSINTANREETSVEVDVLRERLLTFESEKEEYAKQSKMMREKAKIYSLALEEENMLVNKTLSSYFSKYADKFLGLKSYLSFEDHEDGLGRRFVPVIDGTERLSSDELSESQRFFVDHSFRMSLLNLFYQSPAFFICETPDSSLDISYEQNAAEVFLMYLEKPNVLILTSNLNNSSFLEYIIDKAAVVKILNLFDYGKMSPIQQESEVLKTSIEKIKLKIKNKYQ